MKLNTMMYLIKEGIKNLWSSKKTAIASFFIILATMLMLGVFILLTSNIENIVKKAVEIQGISVYIYDVDKQETDNIENQIKNIYLVKSVEYFSKQQVLEEARQLMEEYQSALDGYTAENSPFEAKFVVQIEDLEQIKNIQEQIKKIPNVSDVKIKEESAQKMVEIEKVVEYIAIGVLTVLLAISIFIISNTIKITMFARRKEISIMKYVGATDGFIRLPFIIEGMLIGLIGVIVGTLLIGIFYVNLYNSNMDVVLLGELKGQDVLVPFSQIIETIVLIYVVLGVGIGIIGSTMSIKKYLDV